MHELTDEDIAAEREVRRYPKSDYADVMIPWDRVVTWRITCQCSWTGTARAAIPDAKYNSRDCPEEIEDHFVAPARDAHVAPYVALYDLGELTDQLRYREQRIIDNLQLARAGGASWTQVGRAAGLSRQGAQQRWG